MSRGELRATEEEERSVLFMSPSCLTRRPESPLSWPIVYYYLSLHTNNTGR